MSSVQNTAKRDHGGNLDAAIARYGGLRSDWADLSTGINPVPYPMPEIFLRDWTALPDAQAQKDLLAAARDFWTVPEGAAILSAPGASALIARIPHLEPPARVQITKPTYNEHAAAFHAAGWSLQDDGPADARVLVHPNNPDGRVFSTQDIKTAPMTVIDESFCDVQPDVSLIAHATDPGVIVLKSFGKFWGLAGMRLGFAIGQPALIAHLAESLGPWAVSGPALRVGTQALLDQDWANATRRKLHKDRLKLDELMVQAGASVTGGTDLFGLYTVDDAPAWQVRLAKKHIWTRIFPYSNKLIRLGLPAPDRWTHLEQAL